MQLDSEERQHRAIASLEALHGLLDMIPPDELVEVRYVAPLLALANDAVRDALPKGALKWGAND
ncbi:MAG: hypothetical protein CL802_13560 [Citromicrobium sp.]|nr:hypothetical protein [Citromicrobium sp.]|tara:strand:+ start:842 stop:1033 length:192 start_codon:yes stop_codon:yes gene_type:complete